MIDLDAILERVDSLPAPPDASVRLMEILGNPGASMDEIIDVIRYDQVLTVRILQLCNSAYFGLSRQVTSLSDAMVCLGTVKVLQLVMAMHTHSLLDAEQAGYGLRAGELWRHSVGTALACSQTAQHLNLPDANLVFTAGLLHDIGKVVLNQFVAEEFEEILRRVAEQQADFLEVERQVLGFDHTQVGARIAEQWKLPAPIVRCIRHHHDPGTLDPPDAVVDTVYLADCLCLLLGIGLGVDGLCYRADQTVMQRHGLINQDLERIGACTLSELQSVAQIFGVDAPQEDTPTRAST